MKPREGCRCGRGRAQRSERTSAQGLALGRVPSRNEKARGFTARRLRCRSGSMSEATALLTSRAAMLRPDLWGQKRGHRRLHVGLSIPRPSLCGVTWSQRSDRANLSGSHAWLRVPMCPACALPGSHQGPQFALPAISHAPLPAAHGTQTHTWERVPPATISCLHGLDRPLTESFRVCAVGRDATAERME